MRVCFFDYCTHIIFTADILDGNGDGDTESRVIVLSRNGCHPVTFELAKTGGGYDHIIGAVSVFELPQERIVKLQVPA